MNNFCYIHIPFCTSKCKYCRFASFGTLDKLKINLYVENLVKEIQNNKTGFKNLKSVYFGGGTPSILNLSQLKLILNTLELKFGFDENIEINIEATPITISDINIVGWKKIGINRISMGVQTLNNESLIEIGRGEKGDILNALKIIQNTGFNNVSIDFIIGLPNVKKGEIKENIDITLNNYNFIKHISVYMLEEYYDIPENIDSKFENITYPNTWNKLGIKEGEYLGEYIEVKDFLKTRGFDAYEISNFAKKGYECKHNKSYWDHSNVLAFGLGAHGFINNERYSNSENFIEYYKCQNRVIEKLSDEDLFIENIMFELRTGGLKINSINKLNIDKIKYFINEGYLSIKDDRVVLMDKGFLVMDYILSEII